DQEGFASCRRDDRVRHLRRIDVRGLGGERRRDSQRSNGETNRTHGNQLQVREQHHADFVNGTSIGTRSRYCAYSGCSAMRSRSSSWIAIRMYAVVASANTRCATVIVGVAQKAKNQPTYSG